MTVKTALQKAKTIQSIVFHERFIPPSFSDFTPELKNARGTLCNSEFLNICRDVCLALSKLVRCSVSILPFSTERLSCPECIRLNKQLLIRQLPIRQTHYVRPSRDYAVCFEQLLTYLLHGAESFLRS